MTLPPFEIAGIAVPAGEVARLELLVARLPTQTEVELPVIVVNGGRPGPAVWMTAALHGDEVNGTEIIRRVIEGIEPQALAGTIVAIPVVNVLGFIHQSRYLPDRRDLNRSFPGSATGSLAAQIAHLLMTEVVARCAFGIDLHGGSNHRTNLPQARGDLSNPIARRLCIAFGTQYVVHAKLRSGSLRHAAAQRGVPVVLYEAGEPLRFDDVAIATGTAGVTRVLGSLGMIDTTPPAALEPVLLERTHWVRATRAGLIHVGVRLGQVVKRRQVLATVRDTFGDVAAKVRAGTPGVVIGHTLNPLANRGDAVVNIGELKR